MTPSVIVTGCSKGIGRAIALAFARAGYAVGINYLHSQDQAQTLAQEIQALNAKWMLLPADIRQADAAEKMVQNFVEKFQRLDVLVNNAGLARDRSILRMSADEWQDVIQTNLNGSFWCLQAAAKQMRNQKGGSIFNISSYKALHPARGHANYVASKAAILGLTRAAAIELGPFNIRVNAIMPGFHVTDLSREVWQKKSETILSDHVLGRSTNLQELADFIVTLSQNQSVSGQTFNFDSRIL